MFFKRDMDNILSAMLERITRETPISVTSPGSVARSLFEIMADEIASDYTIFDTNVYQCFLSTAGGQALDKIGAMFNVERKSIDSVIDRNEGSVYFYLNSSADHVPGTANMAAISEITIPEGTRISTNPIGTAGNPEEWETTYSVTIPSGGYLAYASVAPVRILANTTGEGSLVNHSLSPEDFSDVYVYNRRDLSVDSSLESDDNFRFRINNALTEASTGNTLALRMAALSVSGVKEVKVLPLNEGVGTVSVIVVTENPGTLNAEEAFIDAKNKILEVASAGDLVFVEKPIETPVDITGVALGKEGALIEDIKMVMQNSITAYLEGLGLGDPIIYSRIIADSMNISPNIREFAIIDGGFVVGDVPVPRTNIIAKETEQFYPRIIEVN